MIVRAALLGSLLLVTGSGVQPETDAVTARFTAGTSARSIPFEFVHGEILLKVGVGGGPPSTFILDTGANMDVVSLQYAKAAGLSLERWVSGFVGIGEKPPEMHLVTDALTFSLPGVDVSDSQVFAISLDSTQDCLALAAARQPGDVAPVIDGFLGAPFFRGLVVEIDYLQRQIHLYDPSSYAYKGRGRSIPIEMDAMYTYVDAQVSAKGHRAAHAKLVVDTGAGALSLTKQFADAHGIMPPGDTLRPGKECGSAGLSSDPTLVGTLDRLKIGHFTLRHPLTVFYQATASRTYDGLLGGDALQNFTVIFDYSRQRMILEPVRHPK